MDQEAAWKLFSKGLDRESARRKASGSRAISRLGEPVLGRSAVMA